MTTDEHGLVLRELAAGLQSLTGRPFVATEDHVEGPGTTRVVLASHPDIEVSEQSAHIDVGYVLNRDRDDATIWDCSSGFGATKPDAISSAVAAWLRTTALVVHELMVGTGEHADHYPSSETGLPGRHAIHGAILGWGRGDGPDALQQWWLAHPLLPVLAPELRQEPWPTFAALRVFFGSQRRESTAEVTLNARRLEGASRLLLAQDWPRFEEPAYARTFVLLIPETS